MHSEIASQYLFSPRHESDRINDFVFFQIHGHFSTIIKICSTLSSATICRSVWSHSPQQNLFTDWRFLEIRNSFVDRRIHFALQICTRFPLVNFTPAATYRILLLSKNTGACHTPVHVHKADHHLKASLIPRLSRYSFLTCSCSFCEVAFFDFV